MFSLTLIFNLFVACSGIYVYVQVTPPVEFIINTPRIMTCVAQSAIPPVTFQWTIIRAGFNFTFPNSNHSQFAIKFSALENGDIMCQAKGRKEVRFTNSTKVPFYVLPSGGPKQVWINHASPIIFRANRPKLLTCQTRGFTNPISYQWINVSNGAVLGVRNTPTASITFPQRVKNGAIQCQARGFHESVYTPSASVSYKVNGQMSHKINTLFLSVMTVFALTISASQKIL